MKGFINSQQDSLFGHKDIIGFGDDSFNIQLIDRDKANKIIVKNHYSGKFYAASKHHFGLFSGNVLKGVLQFGCAMNPASFASVVAGTKEDEYLELNRMWICDSMPRNTESRSISYCIKVLRRICPNLAWIQSFADERCGRNGVVYQAANFDYVGEHTSTFWELEGQVYHNSLMTRNPELSKSAKYLIENKDRASASEYRQFRYIYFLKKSFKKRLNYTIQPYPKHN